MVEVDEVVEVVEVAEVVGEDRVVDNVEMEVESKRARRRSSLGYGTAQGCSEWRYKVCHLL